MNIGLIEFGQNTSHIAVERYDPYGFGTPTNGINRFSFTGAPYFSGPGLYQMGARYYNPEFGRFITRDTYKGDIYQPWTQNLYTYCHNNPINYTDPTGHWEEGDENLSPTAQAQILKLTYDYFQTNDEDARAAIHKAANDIRNSAKPSSGISGWLDDKAADAVISIAKTTAKMEGINEGTAEYYQKLGENIYEFEEYSAIAVGSVGGPSRIITGFTGHGVQRAIGDGFKRAGVSPAGILDALKNPLKINEIVVDNLGRPSQRFIGRSGEVVINPETGKIISVNPTSSNKVARLLKALGVIE